MAEAKPTVLIIDDDPAIRGSQSSTPDRSASMRSSSNQSPTFCGPSIRMAQAVWCSM